MSARITINLAADGTFEMHLNAEGRDLLARKLLSLSEKNDHIHLAPNGMGEVEVSKRPYRTDDKVLEWGRSCSGRMHGTRCTIRTSWSDRLVKCSGHIV